MQNSPAVLGGPAELRPALPFLLRRLGGRVFQPRDRQQHPGDRKPARIDTTCMSAPFGSGGNVGADTVQGGT
jgi:hypothetical protein